MNSDNLAFSPEVLRLKVADLVPVRRVKSEERTKRYSSILSSIREIGVIEPVVIFPFRGNPGKYLILDGHLRIEALKELGIEYVDCIKSTQEESYTYNARINRLSPIQEHRMIAKAVNNGVPAERIAAALSLSLEYVNENLRLLEGIHSETVEILGTRNIGHMALRILKKVNPVRQIEIAELMVAANNFSSTYAKALLAATPDEMLVEKAKAKRVAQMSEDDEAKIGEEMRRLEEDFKAAEESYGENILNLTIAKGFLKRLVENTRVARWMGGRSPEVVKEFERIVATEEL